MIFLNLLNFFIIFFSSERTNERVREREEIKPVKFFLLSIQIYIPFPFFEYSNLKLYFLKRNSINKTKARNI